MARREHLAVDREGLAIPPFRTRQVALEIEELGQDPPALRDVRVVIAEDSPARGQGPA